MYGILDIVTRSFIIYVFIVLAIRLFGKKELTQLSIIDLVFILLLSNAVQNAMVGGDSSIVGGLAAATGLFVTNWILKHLIFRSRHLNELLQGGPLLLVYKGKVHEAHMRRAGISQDELEAAVREHGVERVRDVDLAILEVDGNISVMSGDFKVRSSRKRRIHKSLVSNP